MNEWFYSFFFKIRKEHLFDGDHTVESKTMENRMKG